MTDDPNVFMGRPDLEGDHYWGVKWATKFPPYVFSITGNACVVHKIVAVEMRWWEGHYDRMLRRHKPFLIAHTACNVHRFLEAKKTRTCMVPNPDAILCGPCHGELPTFGRHGRCTKEGLSRQVAHVRLGCVVNGY